MNTNTIEYSARASGIISPPALQQLVDNAPDKESLLTIKFCFHLYTPSNELSSLNVDHHFAYSEPGRLVGLMLGSRSTRTRRYISVDTSSADVFVVLLPESGPVFLDPNPFSRLKRLGKNLGIEVGSRLARRSCAAHSRWAGMSECEVAFRMGLRSELFTRHTFFPVGRTHLSGEYFNLNFDPDRLRSLPRYSGRLVSTASSQEEGL